MVVCRMDSTITDRSPGGIYPKAAAGLGLYQMERGALIISSDGVSPVSVAS